MSPDGGVERYSETLQPGWDIFEHIDHQLPLGRRFFWRQVSVTPVAGERSILNLRSPVGSNMIVVPQWAKCDGDSWSFRVSGSLLSADATAQGLARDMRYIGTAGAASSTAQLVSSTDTSANAGTALLSFLTGEIFLVETGIGVITPGREFRLVGGTDNTAAIFAWGWMERLALPGELENARP